MTRRTDTFAHICNRVTDLAAEHPVLERADKDLTDASPHFAAAVQRLMDARPGLPGAASYDGTPGGSSDDSAPERLASQPDRTAGDRRHLDTLLRRLTHDTGPTGMAAFPATYGPRITRDAWSLLRLVRAWTPKPATAKQQASVENDNVAPDGSKACVVCFDILGITVPSYRVSDLGGLLPWPQPVSRWVYDESARIGRLSTPTELRRWASTNDDARKQLVARQPRVRAGR